MRLAFFRVVSQSRRVFRTYTRQTSTFRTIPSPKQSNKRHFCHDLAICRLLEGHAGKPHRRSVKRGLGNCVGDARQKSALETASEKHDRRTHQRPRQESCRRTHWKPHREDSRKGAPENASGRPSKKRVRKTAKGARRSRIGPRKRAAKIAPSRASPLASSGASSPAPPRASRAPHQATPPAYRSLPCRTWG